MSARDYTQFENFEQTTVGESVRHEAAAVRHCRSVASAIYCTSTVLRPSLHVHCTPIDNFCRTTSVGFLSLEAAL